MRGVQTYNRTHGVTGERTEPGHGYVTTVDTSGKRHTLQGEDPQIPDGHKVVRRVQVGQI